jgi:hypothetical protein
MQLAALAFLLMLLPALAMAQQPDPRLSGPLIQALQAQVTLQQAMMNAQQEDRAAQDAQIAPVLNRLRWATNPLAALGQ